MVNESAQNGTVHETVHEKRKGTGRYGHGVKFGRTTVCLLIKNALLYPAFSTESRSFYYCQ